MNSVPRNGPARQRASKPNGKLPQPKEEDRQALGLGRLEGWQAYIFTILVTAATLGLRIAFDGPLGGRPTLVIFTMPIMLSAYMGGLRAGLLSTGLSYFAASYFLLSPLHSFAVASPVDRWQQFFVVLAGVFISGLNEALHRARRRADIATREHREAELDRERFFVLSQDVHCILGFDGFFKDVNPAWQTTLGYTTAELLATPFIEFVHPDDRQRTLAEAAKVSSGKALIAFENRYRCKDGSYRNFQWSVTPVIEDRVMYGVARDITEHKQAEQALREREEQFRLYAEHSPAAIALFDRDMKYLVASQQWMAVYHLGNQSLVGRSHYEVFPEISQRWIEIHRRCLAGAIEKCDEDTFPRANGTTDWVRWEVRPWRQADGAIGGIIIFSEDISDRKRAEEARGTSEARYRTLFECAPDGIVIADANGVYLDANGSICQMLGYTREELIGLPSSRIVSEAEFEHIQPALSAIHASSPYHREWQFRRKDGSTFDAEVIATKMPDGNVLAMIRDITLRKKAEIESERRRAELQFIMDAVPALVFYKDRDGRFVRVNRELAEFLGVPQESLIGKTDADMGAAANSEGFRADDLHVMNTGESIRHREEKINMADGARWLLTDKMPHRDEAGHIIGIIGFAVEITERKRAEAALQESEERFRTMANSMPQLAWIARADGYVFWYNQQWYEYTGTTPEQMEGWGWQGVHDPEVLPSVMEGWKGAIDAGNLFEMEFPLRAADGQFRTFLTRVQPLKDSNGQVTQWFGTNTDVGVLKQAEEKVRLLNDELEQRVTERTAQLEASNKELEAFSYSVSHDLRAPLRGVDGYVRMLKEDCADRLDAEGNRMLDVVSSEAKRMGRLIDDLLAFSRLGREQMESSAVDMTALAGAVFEDLTRIAPESTPRFELKSLPPAQGDLSMLRQVFVNLIGNACKFTRHQPAPVIEVGGGNGGGELTYYVKDNGVGFDEKYSHKLFGVFQRLHSEEEFEGTGVGLALVQRVIHRHGGKVWAEGKPTQGATFYFTLPIRKGPANERSH